MPKTHYSSCKNLAKVQTEIIYRKGGTAWSIKTEGIKSNCIVPLCCAI